MRLLNVRLLLSPLAGDNKRSATMKVVAIQLCSSHVLDENLTVAGRLIKRAAKNNARLVVLPEMFAMMGKKETDKIAVKELAGHGKIHYFLATQARENKLWILFG